MGKLRQEMLSNLPKVMQIAVVKTGSRACPVIYGTELPSTTHTHSGSEYIVLSGMVVETFRGGII